MKQILFPGSNGIRDGGSALLSVLVLMLVVTGLLLCAVTLTETQIAALRLQLQEAMP